MKSVHRRWTCAYCIQYRPPKLLSVTSLVEGSHWDWLPCVGCSAGPGMGVLTVGSVYRKEWEVFMPVMQKETNNKGLYFFFWTNEIKSSGFCSCCPP